MNKIEIKGYDLNESIIDFQTDKAAFQKAEREEDGQEVEILWIKKCSDISIIKRVFNNLRADLSDSKIQNIQKIIEINEDKKNGVHYIVYEAIDVYESEFNKQNFEQIISTLDTLKKRRNLQGFILNEYTVIKEDDDGQIRIRFLGVSELFRKGVLTIKDFEFSEKKKMHDDIVAVSHLFEEYLKNSYKGNDIFEKCEGEKYTKYSEILDDARELPDEPNPYWDNIQVVCNEDKLDIDELVDELNSGCWLIVQDKLSSQDEVQVLWSTKKSSGKFFVDERDYGYLFVSHQNEYPDEKVLQNGQRAELNFEDRNKSDYYYPIPDFLTKPSVNHLAKLKKSKQDTLQIWKALPKNEKKYIDKNAFRAPYVERNLSSNNHENIVFELQDTFDDWEKVKNKKNDKTMLSINDTHIGQILDYKNKEKIIVIKDCKEPLDAIPQPGELVEDVTQLTSQYKKQIEACEKFSNRDIVNPELSALIATPEEVQTTKHIEIDYDDFEDKIVNKQLREDETQKSAVIEALHRKPIYLIQGPPGTGKTTVIVEMIQQFIKANKNKKILVVSQSNTAVDNVLERLPEEIKFIRLASEDAVKKDKISESIKEHTFETKLKTWSSTTAKQSQNNFDKKFPKIDKPLSQLYKDFQKKPKISFQEFTILYQKTKKFKNYYEKIFHKAKNIQEIHKIFKEKLGMEYMALSRVHSDWLAFVNNATSFVNNATRKKNQHSISTIKHGSKDIPLYIAFAKSMHVSGSTCIHIASSKYSSMDFKFDVMIMDESSKATDAEALVPINMSKNIILIGDHKQLPPVVTREQEVRAGVKKDLEDEGLDIDKTYGESMFERLITHFESENRFANLFTMLDIQYRMPRQIGYLISEYIYEGKLKNPSLDKVPDYDKDKAHNISLKKQTVTHCNEQIPNSIIAISTSKLDKPYDNDNKTKRANKTNIDVIKKTLTTLNTLCNNNESIPAEIGIIAAYRGQVELAQSLINKKEYNKLFIDINTVDQFQGMEKDIIIYDVVRSSKSKSNIGFLDDYRRINVAFSRAKKLLLVVGDSDFVLKKVQSNPNSKIADRKNLHLVKIFRQLEKWGCIYSSFEEALQNGQ